MTIATGAAVAFRNPEGAILLVQRDDRPGIANPGCWSLPGGYLEPGERPIDAARRECREELEIEPRLSRFIGLYPDDGRAIALYAAALKTPAESIVLHEGQRVEWVRPREALDRNLSPWLRPYLERIARW